MERRLLWLCGFVLCLAATAPAQTKSEVAVGYAWLSKDGNMDVFASQYNLSDGPFLDRFHLDLRPYLQKGFDRFELDAAGFGAEPWGRASFRAEWDRTWIVRIDFSRREMFFRDPDSEVGASRADWRIERWNASVIYDNFRPARLRLDLHQVQRTGSESLPFYGLGAPYVASHKLDERVQEAGLSVETRTLPVKILVEQDYARYVYRSRGKPGNSGQPAGGTDPDVLSAFTTPGEDTNDVPTTRLSAVYRDPRFELVADGLYRRDKLEADRNDAVLFALSGGAVGTAGIVDAVMGTSDRDIKSGNFRFGYSPISSLTLRVRAHYESSSQDSTLLGDRILQMAGSGGSVEYLFPVDTAGWFDRTDKDVTGEVEWRTGGFGLVVDYHDGSRKVDYLTGTAADDSRSVTRDSKGWGATASYAFSRVLSAEVGWKNGTFERYVFRTDPETVTRVWGKLRVRPVTGVELSAHASHEKADNPTAQSNLDRRDESYGVAATFTNTKGAFVAVSVDWLKLTSDIATLFYAPAATTGLSSYETKPLSLSLQAAVPLTKAVRIAGGALRIKDDGASQPFTTESYDLRLELAGPLAMDYALFADHWKYTSSPGDARDYKATRYGVSLGRRF